MCFKHTCIVAHKKGTHLLKVNHRFRRLSYNDFLFDDMSDSINRPRSNIAGIIYIYIYIICLTCTPVAHMNMEKIEKLNSY